MKLNEEKAKAGHCTWRMRNTKAKKSLGIGRQVLTEPSPEHKNAWMGSRMALGKCFVVGNPPGEALATMINDNYWHATLKLRYGARGTSST